MIERIIENLNTPCYIFDEGKLIDRVRDIKKNLGERYQLCYSMKANPFLVPYLVDYVDRIEVCSHGEFNICKLYDIIPEKILYTGINKQFDEIEEAISYGVDHFNVESLRHLEYIGKAAENMKKTVSVILRISSGNQFGMSEEDILRAFNAIANNRYIKGIGLHYFAGTALSNKKRDKHLDYLRKKILCYREFFGDKIEIEYGPGLPVRYFMDENEDFDQYVLEEMVKTLNNDGAGGDEKWTIEMGRFIAASCGRYMTEVVDIKTNNAVNYIIVDGGINHLSYYGQNMALRIPVIETNSGMGNKSTKYWVCGSLCTTADVLVKDIDLPDIAVGNKILFENCGAYANTESNYLFLSRNMPFVYLRREDNSIIELRSNLTTYELNSRRIKDA